MKNIINKLKNIIKKKKLLLYWIIIAMFFSTTIYALNQLYGWLRSYWWGINVEIFEWPWNNKIIVNPTTKDYFIPNETIAEWNAFPDFRT